MRRPAPITAHPRSALSLLLRLAAVACASLGFPALAAPVPAAPLASGSQQAVEQLPRGVYRTEPMGQAPTGRASRSPRRPHFPAPPLEEVYVFQDSLDGHPIADEGSWTHYDNSGGPTAWHIDTVFACTNHAWWCGMVDSSWIYDSNRAGYDNNWTQILDNSVDLRGTPPGTVVTLSFNYRIKAESGYDGGVVQVGDLTEIYLDLASFTGASPAGGGCGFYSVTIPESTWTGWNNYPGGGRPQQFRFVFTSDGRNSSADGLYDGDGWIIDNVTVTAGAVTKFSDDMESGMGSWNRTTLPAVGDYYALANNVATEDLCTDNRTNVWVDWDPVNFALIPRLDDRLNTPPVFVNRSSEVLVAFDIYRNLPLDACFYYSLNYRTRNAGAPWGLWRDPTGLLYYGSSKDWIRQKVVLPEAGGKDTVQVQFIVKDWGPVFCGGSTAFANVYPLFDNIAIGVKATAPPVFIQRDLDLFNDTFRTTTFFSNDNFNTPLGDSAVVQVSTSRGYKNGFMYYRFNNGSWNSLALQQSAPSLPTYRWADVPPGAYAAGTKLEYYFAVTDSADSVGYLPAKAPLTQTYFSASILPLKTAINPVLGCTDSLAQILFINDNAGRETEATIAKALTAQGYKFDTWDVNGPTSGAGNTPGGPPAGDPFYFWPPASTNDLLRYSTIIWHAGSLSQYTLRQTDQALFQSWIQQAGKNRNLLIVGDNVAWELIVLNQNYNSFLDFTMGARYLRNLWENTPQDTLHPVVTGYAGSPSAGRFMHANSDCPFIEDFDLIGTATSAPSRGKSGNFLKYPNNLAAATRFATKYTPVGLDSARTLMMAFNYNNIEETGERYRLIKNIMTDYFQVPACYYPTAVEDDPTPGAPPLPSRLFQNAPNPFNPATAIRYSLTNAGWATIRVYSVGGALVRTLVDKHHAAGVYTVRWDGKDDSARRLPSGVYFYKLETAWGAKDAKKLLMLK